MKEVPEGWVRVRMEDVVRINPPKIKPDYEDQMPLVFVPMARVAEEFGGIDVSNRRPFSSIKRGYTQFRPSDVLFAKITPCMENGKIAIVPEIQPPVGYGSTEFFVMRPRADGIGPWIAHCVARSRFRELARENMQGAVGQRRVPKVWLQDVSVPLAPLPEQHHVIAKIEDLFAKLDVGIAALRRAQANLERYRASVLKAAVEGRLTEQWRNTNPPAETGEELLGRTLAERRKCWEEEQLAKFEAKGKKPPKNWKAKYREPVAPDPGELPELPEGWCWATVDQLGNVGSGITKGGKKRDVARRAVPYLRVANVQRGWLDLRVVKTILASEDEIRRYSLESGDVLFNEGGDRDKLGRGCVWRGDVSECLHQNHVFRVRPFLRDYSSEFLSHYGNSAGREWFFRRATQSVNLASINQTVLRSLPVPLPPLQEQKHIVRRLANTLRSGEFAGTELIGQLNRATSLRQSILQRAFEGRLVPQDPADEPASVLLERIQAEREAERKRRKRPTKPRRQRKSQVT